jgi:HPr kinase/phosphorylase
MTDAVTLHGTCVACGENAVLIFGASGSGKSALALQMMALGAVLVADDRVAVSAEDARLIARCPPAISGLIEARGVGVLKADCQPQAQVVLVVDLDQTETARLPDGQLTRIAGCDIPLIKRFDGPHFAATVLQILRGGWSER